MNKNNDVLILWCVSTSELMLEPVEENIYFWNGYEEGESTSHYLLSYIEKHSDRLRQKYLAWIYELGESVIYGKRLIDHCVLQKDFSYWWMTLFVEKSVYKSPITDAIRLLAIEEILVDRQPKTLHVVSSNKNLKKVLHLLCGALNIKFNWEYRREWKRGRFSLKNLYRKVPYHVQGLLSLLSYVNKCRPFKSIKKPTWLTHSKSIFICSYFDNFSRDEANKGTFYSYYWCGLHHFLKEKKVLVNWLQMLVPFPAGPSADDAAHWLQAFNALEEQQNVHGLLERYLDAGMIARVIRHWFWLSYISLKCMKRIKAFRSPNTLVSLGLFMQRDWKRSMHGPLAISNLFIFELFDHVMKEVPTQKMGLYLAENQGWERAFIYAWRKHGHGCLYGVAHSTVRYWDLRNFFDPRVFEPSKKLPLPHPDAILFNGGLAQKRYQEAMYPQRLLLGCEALRYDYLNSKIKHRGGGQLNEKMKVLILGDFLVSSTEKILDLIEAAQKREAFDFSYTLKPHPNSPIQIEKFPSLTLDVVSEPLLDVLPHYDCVISSNGTSAAVEAYIFGIVVAIVLDTSDLNFSPLRACSGVYFIHSSRDVAEFFRAEKILNHQSDVKNIFYFNKDFPRWSHLLIN